MLHRENFNLIFVRPLDSYKRSINFKGKEIFLTIFLNNEAKKRLIEFRPYNVSIIFTIILIRMVKDHLFIPSVLY
jgi:hypothetical protein